MSQQQVDKEKDCFERLRTLNKRKSHISALRRYSNHLTAVKKFVGNRLEKEQNRETQNYLKRFISYIDAQLDMIQLSIDKGLREIEDLEDAFDLDCAKLVEEKRQEFMSVEYNITYENPNNRGDVA